MSCLCGGNNRTGKTVDSNKMEFDALAILKDIRLFKSLDPKALKMLSKKLEKQVFPAGGFLMRYGETGSEFFIIAEGKCEVLDASKQVVAELKPSDYCGEQSLVREQKRNASVRAVGQVVTF